MLPAILGNAAVQVNIIVNTHLASQITDAAGHVLNGPVSWLNYAFRFLQLPLGLFGVAIASATLPAISRSVVADRMDEFRDGAGEVARHRAAADDSVLGGAGGSGREHDRRHLPVGQVQRCRHASDRGGADLVQRWAWRDIRLIKVLAPAFYALGDARTPVLVSLARSR